MTTEEAGQMVLEGNHWLICGECLGSGWHGGTTVRCHSCTGEGLLLKPEHAEAFKLLEMKQPYRPLSEFEREQELLASLTHMRSVGVKIDEDYADAIYYAVFGTK